MKVKFGILAFPSLPYFPRNGLQYQFEEGVTFHSKPVQETLGKYTETHWQRWIGEIGWEEFSKSEHQIQIIRTSQTAEVHDQESSDIQLELQRYYKALSLIELMAPPRYPPITITGHGTVEAGILAPESINSYSKGQEWLPGQHILEQEFYLGKPWHYSDAHGSPYRAEILDDWKKIALMLREVDGKDDFFLLNLSIAAYRKALAEPILDFNFPNLVRAIETLAVLGRGYGPKDFAARAARYAPNQAEIRMTISDENILKLLSVSYQLRSDSVHGKPFAHSLGQGSKSFLESEIHRVVYLLETTSRRIILEFLSNPSLRALTGSRSKMEAHWDSVCPKVQS